MIEQIIGEYNEAVFDTDRERALKMAHDAVDRGMTPEDVVFKIDHLEAVVQRAIVQRAG